MDCVPLECLPLSNNNNGTNKQTSKKTSAEVDGLTLLMSPPFWQPPRGRGRRRKGGAGRNPALWRPGLSSWRAQHWPNCVCNNTDNDHHFISLSSSDLNTGCVCSNTENDHYIHRLSIIHKLAQIMTSTLSVSASIQKMTIIFYRGCP